MADENAQQAGPRSFAHFLLQVGDGDLHRDLSAALHDLSGVLQEESGRLSAKQKGEISLKLKVCCDPRGVMGIDWDVDVKKPKKRRATAQGWVDRNGNVVFEPPRQTKLPLHEVPRDRELRGDVGDAREMKGV